MSTSAMGACGRWLAVLASKRKPCDECRLLLLWARSKKEPPTLKDGLCTTFFFFAHFYYTFQFLDKPWSQVSSLLPPGSCLQFLSRIGFSNPTARRFSSSVANSRSRAFRKSICAQEKLPTNIIRVCTRRGSNSRN